MTAPRNPRIRIVQESEATGETAAIYDEVRSVFGIPMVPDIVKLVSTRPDFFRVLLEGYKAMFFARVRAAPGQGDDRDGRLEGELMQVLNEGTLVSPAVGRRQPGGGGGGRSGGYRGACRSRRSTRRCSGSA